MESALRDGHLVVELHGHKLRGGYALARTGVDRRGRELWLLVKKRGPRGQGRLRPCLEPAGVGAQRPNARQPARTAWRLR